MIKNGNLKIQLNIVGVPLLSPLDHMACPMPSDRADRADNGGVSMDPERGFEGGVIGKRVGNSMKNIENCRSI